MGEFDRIKEEMKKQNIVPRIRYELMVIRALKVAAVLLIGAGIVWLMAKLTGGSMRSRLLTLSRPYITMITYGRRRHGIYQSLYY